MMKRCIFAVSIAALMLASTSSAHAQAMPAASRPGLLQAGITLSDANTDELTKRIGGASAYATFDFSENLGVEFDAHVLTFDTPQDFGEESFLLGHRYVKHYKDRYDPYVRAQAGIGKTISQNPYVALGTPGTPGTYGAYAFAGGLDIRIPYNLSVRAIDYEYQLWPGFKPNGLSPSMVSVGIAYRIR